MTKSTNCRLIFGSSFRDLNYGPWPDRVCIHILLYKSQQDAHVTELILSDNCSTVGTNLSVLWVAYATHNTLKSVPTIPR